MDKHKRNRLKSAGWEVGTAAQFLGLSDDEAAYVELKVALSESLRNVRTNQKLTQTAMAKRLQSSQSRVAKMEAADPSVSIDLLVRSLLKLGARSGDIARVLAASAKTRSGRRVAADRNSRSRREGYSERA
jgi:DNA-binding XRE family transcriptional regulator